MMINAKRRRDTDRRDIKRWVLKAGFCPRTFMMGSGYWGSLVCFATYGSQWIPTCIASSTPEPSGRSFVVNCCYTEIEDGVMLIKDEEGA